MKHVTSFLMCMLALVIGAMFVFNFLGVTEPVIYYSQFEQQSVYHENSRTDSDLNGSSIPSYYNCIDSGKINKTRDQGELGVCWAFAANAALESRLLPEEQWDFSEDHMIYNNDFYGNAAQGGDYYMAIAYLSSWKGPVPEEQDPYNDGVTNQDAVVVKHLQEAIFLNDADQETIKKMIYKYGAVESSIYISIDSGQYIDETYYNRYYYSYCYDGNEDPNHEVVIIGWDDDYPYYDFNTGAYSDGAFICLNSWGSDFGNNGLFYVSYEDKCIGENVEVYSVIEDNDNYSHIYQNDQHGWVGRMGFDSPEAYFANVYTVPTTQILRAVSFYATGEDTSYNVYVCRNFSSSSDLLSKRKLYAYGSFEYAGYYTVKLDEPVRLDPGETFAVIVQINTPGSNHPVAIEMDAGDGRTGEVITDGKKSFISDNGRVWENTQEDSNSNICLKAFTDDVK